MTTNPAPAQSVSDADQVARIIEIFESTVRFRHSAFGGGEFLHLKNAAAAILSALSAPAAGEEPVAWRRRRLNLHGPGIHGGWSEPTTLDLGPSDSHWEVQPLTPRAPSYDIDSFADLHAKPAPSSALTVEEEHERIRSIALRVMKANKMANDPTIAILIADAVATSPSPAPMVASGPEVGVEP